MCFFKLVCIVLIGLLSMTTASLAEQKPVGTRFWGGIDAGVGLFQQEVDALDEDDTTFFLGFKAGYTINPHLRLGIELSGWLLEESNLEDPRVGEAINQVFLIARYYPIQKSSLFAKIGGGYVSIWNNRPGASRNTGWGITVGGGYDFLLTPQVALSPFISYSFGDADDIDYQAISFGIGLTFQ